MRLICLHLRDAVHIVIDEMCALADSNFPKDTVLRLYNMLGKIVEKKWYDELPYSIKLTFGDIRQWLWSIISDIENNLDFNDRRIPIIRLCNTLLKQTYSIGWLEETSK